MEKIKLTIDGIAIEADPGTTLLDAAQAQGVFIPSFCHNRKLKPFASCFVCVVEIDGRANLVPSCSTAVAPGMVVRTKSERVKLARRTCVELLMSDHLGDCLGPCMGACPAGIDIPGFVKHLALGEDRAALELIKTNMPLPATLGRVCPRPCEEACRRQLVEEPVAICHLKRYAADAGAGDESLPKPAKTSGKKVAIVGAGPAGLAASYYLQLLGHKTVIIDAHEAPGGMLRFGIPAYRLPRDVIDREYAVAARLGAEFRFGTRLGKDVSLDDLRRDHDAVFLGLGAQRAQAMRVPGEDSPGVLSGIGFLAAASRDEKTPIGRRVMVVGGGNTAIDAARTSMRLGAKEVTILYRRTRAEMPAWAMEVHEAEVEGVKLEILAAPTKIEKQAGGSLAVTCIRMTLGEPDASGRARPVPQEGSEHVRVVDNVIAAIGQSVDAKAAAGVEIAGWGGIVADERTGRTSLENVFAGGDCVIGADIAVRAVAAGRRAAIAIDQFLMGKPVVGEVARYNASMGKLADISKKVIEGREKAAKARMPELEPRSRVAHFKEVETGYTAAQIRAEAQRCLECGCRDARGCRLRTYAMLFEADPRRFAGQKREYERDDSHPGVVYEAHKCIQCGTCVRMTEEIFGTSALGFTFRGFASRVRPALGRPLAKIDDNGLLQIVEACPVGALVLKKAPVAVQERSFKRPPVPGLE
ncbi:MAG: FAD-dependent oxidoreductase [Deltaproteobacteria bacterium]|nr:FAD-dependent oxidoreductase [Deltaproteobacteria bacterium]